MNLLYFIFIITIIIILFGIANLLINNLNNINSNITIDDKQILQDINSNLSEVYYITGWYEFEILIQLIQSIRDGYYPKSGIIKPFETWMILARKHYSKYYFHNINSNVLDSNVLDSLDKNIENNSEILDNNNKNKIKIHFDRLEWLEEEEHVLSIINNIKLLSSKLQSVELFPCRFHLWLCCILFSNKIN